MKIVHQLGDYRFVFADEESQGSLDGLLKTLVVAPDQLDGFEPLQARQGRSPHVFRFRAGDRWYVGKWSRSHNVIDRAKNLLRLPKARRAWRNSRRLSSLGVDTPRVLAYGERRKAGLVRRSVLISEYVRDAWQLDDFLRRFGHGASGRPLRRALMRTVGETLGRLHQAGIFHSDFRAANLLVQKRGEQFRLFVVDTEPMRRCGVLSRAQRLKDLTTLNFTFVRCVTMTDRLRVFGAYADAVRMSRAERKRWLARTIAACERSMHMKVFKPRLRRYHIPSGLAFRDQVNAITEALEGKDAGLHRR